MLLKAEAAYQLHLIDLWYENQPGKALAMLDELRARYPHNPMFLLNTAQVARGLPQRPAGGARCLSGAR